MIDVLNDEDVPAARELRQRYLPWTIADYRPGAMPVATDGAEDVPFLVGSR